MDRLSFYLTLMTGAVFTGIVAITLMTLGYYNWYALGGAAVVGWLLAWPVAFAVSRRIKRNDPHWKTEDPTKHGVVPKPGAPEV